MESITSLRKRITVSLEADSCPFRWVAILLKIVLGLLLDFFRD